MVCFSVSRCHQDCSPHLPILPSKMALRSKAGILFCPSNGSKLLSELQASSLPAHETGWVSVMGFSARVTVHSDCTEIGWVFTMDGD